MQGVGCEVLEISDGPKNEDTLSGAAGVHRVKPVSLATAAQLILVKTPTTLVLDQKNRVIWSYVGAVQEADWRAIERRLQSPIWLTQLRFEKTRVLPTRTPLPAPHIEPVAVPVRQGEVTYGPAGAPIQIVEFSDFECPYCAAASKQLRAVTAAYQGRVCVSLRQFPLGMHKNSRLAADAAVAAGYQGKFTGMHDALFSHSKPLDRSAVLTCALELGLDQERFQKDLAAPYTLASVERDVQLGNQLEVQGTPTIFVNGRRYVGPITQSALRSAIESQLGK